MNSKLLIRSWISTQSFRNGFMKTLVSVQGHLQGPMAWQLNRYWGLLKAKHCSDKGFNMGTLKEVRVRHRRDGEEPMGLWTTSKVSSWNWRGNLNSKASVWTVSRKLERASWICGIYSLRGRILQLNDDCTPPSVSLNSKLWSVNSRETRLRGVPRPEGPN